MLLLRIRLIPTRGLIRHAHHNQAHLKRGIDIVPSEGFL